MIAKHKKQLDLKSFYKEFLRHTSNRLPAHLRLTDMEIEVLTEFWALEGDLVEKDRFSTSAKRYVREDVFHFKNYANLENYLSSLMKKGYIIKAETGRLFINPRIDLSKKKVKESGKITLVYEFEINV